MSAFIRPFDDFRALLHNLPEPDAAAVAQAQERQSALAKPQNGLGRLEEIAVWLCGWRGQATPLIAQPLAAVFAASHGAAEELYGNAAAASAKIAQNIIKGGAAVSQICLVNDLGLKVYELALEYPTENISRDAAMIERACAATMAFGMESVAGADLLCLGAAGAGGGIAAAALACQLFGGAAEDWLPAGAEREAELVRRALERHKAACDAGDSFDALRCLGGREMAAITGAILAARTAKIPVILDGMAVCAAAAVLHKANPRALDHCLAGHVSAEPGHRKLLELLGKKPLLDLGLALGEGAGAALAAPLVKSAALCHAQMAELAPAAE